MDMPVSGEIIMPRIGYEYDSCRRRRSHWHSLPSSPPVRRRRQRPAALACTGLDFVDGSAKVISTQYCRPVVVLIFYRGSGCIECMKQLNSFAQQSREFAVAGIDIVAISTGP